MLLAPAYGGYKQRHFKARQLDAMSVNFILWRLVIVDMAAPE
jgi:hypothetical protein